MKVLSLKKALISLLSIDRKLKPSLYLFYSWLYYNDNVLQQQVQFILQ